MEGKQNGTLSSSHLERSIYPLLGYYLSRKKLSKLRFEQFLLLCKHHNIDTVELTPDYFERSTNRIPRLILHKLEDDPVSRRLIEQIRRLCSSTTIILDRFESISKLLDRYEQYKLLNSDREHYLVPKFIRVNDGGNSYTVENLLNHARISYPILCKPIQAHGDFSHQMKIIFDSEHLADIDKPCVLQEFIDHDGVLFKIFAVGQNNYHIVQRNSIRNLHDFPSKDTISFRSNEVSSSQADHVLLSSDVSVNIMVDETTMHKIAQTVQGLFQLNLVGIDVILDRTTGDYAVIDVNYFPGYEGVKDFSSELFQLCQNLLNLS